MKTIYIIIILFALSVSLKIWSSNYFDASLKRYNGHYVFDAYVAFASFEEKALQTEKQALPRLIIETESLSLVNDNTTYRFSYNYDNRESNTFSLETKNKEQSAILQFKGNNEVYLISKYNFFTHQDTECLYRYSFRRK